MASAQEALSPTSSKRSRSRDSRDSTNSNNNNSNSNSYNINNTPLVTPSVSTNSLIIPSSTPGTPSSVDHFVYDGTPYPAFLRQRPTELNSRWIALELAQLERGRDGAQARCNTEEYAPRNRYANVDPYQANRVRLDVPEGHSDYINASPIPDPDHATATTLTYIATQGPKQDSWSHIWRMIWKENQDPAVVIMLTQTHETGREKCYPYYPQSLDSPDMPINEHDEFNDGFLHNLHLNSLHHDDEARTQVREITMTADESDETRTIWHLLFSAWPDFSAPDGADRQALLNLIDMSRAKNSDNATNPRIVHCSAGIGRSGTFIALDWLMQELHHGTLDHVPDAHDPIFHVIEKLRDQRAGMVQSKIQFLFLYDTLREQWRLRWIAAHPAEAASLGISSTSTAATAAHPVAAPTAVSTASSDTCEPALKRQKSMQAEHGHVTDWDALEAELMESDMSYENGKT
ncbi:protein-tyrosine phosphatase-like protein [Phaeosphaeriaceae sp. PMI808]|nr:protein-tyrosine phosphatase-like protein [Phaeosphaeriaceae sp. PMI808]